MSNNFIKHIKLTQFRNFNSIQASFSDRLNIITGLNGAGKSSLIDAIHCLAFGRSYFSSSDRYIVKQETQFYRLEGMYSIQNEAYKMVCKYPLGSKKVLEINDKKNARLSDHVGLCPIICIAPGDVTLITEGSEFRRKLLDHTLSQYDKEYLTSLNSYNRLIKQRSAWLKAQEGLKKDITYLQTIDQQIMPLATLIHQKRKVLTTELNELFGPIHTSITGEKERCHFEYKSHMNEGSYLEMVQPIYNRDIAIGRSSRGIHKDDLIFYIHDLTLKQIGSQGQVKSFLFAIKLAQMEKLMEQTEKTPILLLDDIFDKLDDLRVAQIMQMVFDKWKGQIFITDTSLNRLDSTLKALSIPYQHIHIENQMLSIHPS